MNMKKTLIGLLLLFSVTLTGCAGYVPGRQAYWDAQVREMCERDGGVTIYEKLSISRSDVDLLGRVGETIGIPAKELANPKAPVYEEIKITYIKKGNPQVTRSEMNVVRRSDRLVIARAVIYARSGGDFPSPSHPSSFSCPDMKVIRSDLQQLFVVQGEKK